jgi:hypothetical protein
LGEQAALNLFTLCTDNPIEAIDYLGKGVIYTNDGALITTGGNSVFSGPDTSNPSPQFQLSAAYGDLTRGDNGGFNVVRTFQVIDSNGGKGTSVNGQVIQNVTYKFDIKDSSGQPIKNIYYQGQSISSPTTYNESFEIWKGTGVDSWFFPGLEHTQGTLTISASAKYYNGQGVPSAMGYDQDGLFNFAANSHPFSGSAPSTTSNPPFWYWNPFISISNSVSSSITVKWGCSGSNQKTQVVSQW